MQKARKNFDTCPSCGQEYPWHPDYRKWCSHCDWNFQPETVESDSSFLSRVYQAKGIQYGNEMLEKLAKMPEVDLKPKMSAASLLARLIALLVHAVSIFLAASGVYIIVTGWPHVMLIILGGLVLALAWVLRPRFDRPPENALGEKDYPALFALVNQVSGAVGGKMVRHLVVDENFNASYGLVGWRGQAVMTIGLPLWTVLSMQQRIAIIGHEAAHGVNGDPVRGFLVGSAMETLSNWLFFLRPDFNDDLNLIERAAFAVLWLISWPVELLIHILSHLMWQESQKAEFLADFLATKAAGTDAMVNALFKLGYHNLLERVLVTGVTSRSQPGHFIFDAMRKKLREFPAHEKLRIEKMTVIEGATLDATHPPTAHRIAFLNYRKVANPAVILSTQEQDRLKAEMNQLEEQIGKAIINDALYHH